jgi:hypothetical protein
MPSKSIRYEVLIASPGDVVAERDVVDEVIRDWDSSHSKATGVSLHSRRWEFDAIPELGDRPQGVINRQMVDDSDLVIALFSARLGTPTGVAVSGTVEEIERLRGMGKHVMVYFSSAPVPREHNPEQLRLLNEYKRELLKGGLCFDFKDGEDLRRKLSHALATRMSVVSGVPGVARQEPPPSLPPLIISRQWRHTVYDPMRKGWRLAISESEPSEKTLLLWVENEFPSKGSNRRDVADIFAYIKVQQFESARVQRAYWLEMADNHVNLESGRKLAVIVGQLEPGAFVMYDNPCTAKFEDPFGVTGFRPLTPKVRLPLILREGDTRPVEIWVSIARLSSNEVIDCRKIAIHLPSGLTEMS